MKLFVTGEIRKLVSSTMMVLLVISLVLLFFMTAYTLITSVKGRSTCNCGHEHEHGHDHDLSLRKGWIVFLIPVIIGLFVPYKSSQMKDSNLQ